jgi:hypothetical protein
VPLEHSKSKAAFQHNVKKEIESGKSQEQAVAIAYSIERKAGGKDENESAREYDVNGWPEIRDNPLSREGIFPYSGETVGGDPNRIYNVYRPEEELSNPDTIASFKLIPIVDDHPNVLLGDSNEGLTPAEKKGIEGIIGEDVYFKDGILYGNIKILSEGLSDLIESGKKQLSAGYRCIYEIVSGTWNGVQYDAIQREIRGNHLALVEQGRMGKEVAVLDHSQYTFDSIEITKEFKMPEEKKEMEKEESKKALDDDKAKDDDDDVESKGEGEKSELSIQEVHAWAKKNMPKYHELKEMMKGEGEEEEGTDDDDNYKEGYDAVKPTVKGIDKEEEEKKKDGMDSAMDKKLEIFKKSMLSEVSNRNALAEKLSHDIGTFDHADKTLAEVAVYGVKKLGIKCPKGSETIALDAYYHNRTATKTGYGLDSASNTSVGMDANLAKYLNENSI